MTIDAARRGPMIHLGWYAVTVTAAIWEIPGIMFDKTFSDRFKTEFAVNR
jgi:hypothetical protein